MATPRTFRTLAAIALGASALASVVGCGEDADPASRITTLRVIAVRADKPYAKPGDTVHLDSIWYDGLDPDLTKRSRTWAWTMCVNPPSTDVVSCFAKVAKDAAATGRAPPFAIGNDTDTFQLTIPGDAISSLPEPARVFAEVGVILIVCPGDLKLPDATTPITPGTFPVKCIDPSGRELGLDEFEAGVKRIFVRESTTNANPKIDSITWDGATWAAGDVKSASACDTTGNRYDRCDSSLAHDLALNVTPDSFESGTDEFGQSFVEQLVTQYYATEGIFQYDVKVSQDPGTSWVARTKASGTQVRMWLVARDNRGGVTWDERRVNVQ
jgi:hypothetical protein